MCVSTIYLWWWCEDRARDGETPVDVTEVLGHDGQAAPLGVARWCHNTLYVYGERGMNWHQLPAICVQLWRVMIFESKVKR